jgi:hypothetical protein
MADNKVRYIPCQRNPNKCLRNSLLHINSKLEQRRKINPWHPYKLMVRIWDDTGSVRNFENSDINSY